MNIKNKIPLDWENTFHYFFKHLFYGNHLSAEVLKVVNLKEGTFYTILPQSTNFEQLYNFKNGSIIPQIKDMGTSDSSNAKNELTSFIYHFLQQSTNHYSVGEDKLRFRMHKIDEIPNTRLLFNNRNVYYSLHHDATPSSIETTISRCNTSNHMLIVLAEGNIQLKQELTEEMLREVAIQAKFLIGSAYDAQSYIIWERNS